MSLGISSYRCRATTDGRVLQLVVPLSEAELIVCPKSFSVNF